MATLELAEVVYYVLAFAIYFPTVILTYLWVADSRGVYADFSREVRAAASPYGFRGFIGMLLYIVVVSSLPFWDRLPYPWGHIANIGALCAFAVASVLLRAAVVLKAAKFCQRADAR